MGRRQMFCAVCGEVSLGLTYCSPKCKQKAYRDRKANMKKAQARMIDMETYTMQEKMIDTMGSVTQLNFANFYDEFGKEAYRKMIHVSFSIFDELVQEILNGRS